MSFIRNCTLLFLFRKYFSTLLNFPSSAKSHVSRISHNISHIRVLTLWVNHPFLLDLSYFQRNLFEFIFLDYFSSIYLIHLNFNFSHFVLVWCVQYLLKCALRHRRFFFLNTHQFCLLQNNFPLSVSWTLFLLLQDSLRHFLKLIFCLYWKKMMESLCMWVGTVLQADSVLYSSESW